MKILHIIAGGPQGGAETFFADAVEALDDCGVEQYVICRPWPALLGMLQRRNIPHLTMPFSRFSRYRARRAIRRTERAFQPDVVHAWMGRAASFLPARLAAPVLGWFGGYYDLKRYRNCDFYTGVSRDIVRYIAEKTGRPERTFLNHTFGTLTPAAPVLRSALATPADAPLILLLSRMHSKKGVDLLLQAAVQLPGAYFWLAGDGPELVTYQRMAADLGVADRVRFLGWRDDRAALLGAADICTLPSRYEPFGTVIPEAWSMGVPLVAARAAGPEQYIAHEENGLLCDIDDAPGLALQLRRLMDDKALRRQIVAGGTKSYETLFTRDIAIDSLIETYRQVTIRIELPC